MADVFFMSNNVAYIRQKIVKINGPVIYITPSEKSGGLKGTLKAFIAYTN